MTHQAVSADLLLARAGAWLLLLSLLTGFYVAGAATGVLSVDPKMALGAHIAGMSGAVLLLAFGWSVQFLRFSDLGKRRMAWLMIIPAAANWLITAVKAALHVPGLNFTGNPQNDVVFILLNIFVVLPSLVAAAGWVYGLHRKGNAQ